MNTRSIRSIFKTSGILILIQVVIFSNTPVIAQSIATPPQASSPANPEIPSDWLVQAQEHIRQSEYRINWVEESLIPGAPASFQAPNRAQNLRFYFQPDGLRVIQREEERPSWVWGLSLVSYGRQVSLNPLEPTGLTAEDTRVTYQYGQLEQVFDNSEAGLGQKITIFSKPDNRIATHLVVRLEVTGDFSLHRLPDGDLQFEYQDEPVLDYSLLYASDAVGRRLAAHLDVGQAGLTQDEETSVQAGSYIDLVLDDSEAQYPLQASMLLSGLDTTYDWYTYGGLPLAHLGTSVATAGDVNGDGYSDVLIGAPDYDAGQHHGGEVYAFYGSPDGLRSDDHDWARPGNPAEGARMGESVATAGDVNGDGFSDVIVGSPGADSDPYQDCGKAYVYYGSENGLSTSPDWTLQINQESIFLGTSVATAGDLNGDGYSDVVVGAPWYDDVNTDSGIIYVQYGSSTGLPEGYAWYYAGVFEGDRYGYSVATAGDINADGRADLLVGAPYYGTNEAHDNQAGRVHLFLGSTSKTAPTNAYKSFYGKYGGDHFGWSVSTAGDVNGDGYADIIIGAPRADISPETVTAEGEAYIYYGFPEMDTDVDWFTRGDDEQGKLGYSVATAGDVNADGYGDVIIGQPYFDDSEFAPDEGRAMLFLGGVNGMGGAYTSPSDADWVADGNTDDALFGLSVATAGDVNGDGWSDLLVGAPHYDVSGSDEVGLAFLFYGGWLNLSSTAGWTYSIDGSPEGSDSRFGWSVATAGDINGDGYADIIVGAPFYDSAYTNEGAAFVFDGVSGLGWQPAWFALGHQTNAYFGWSVNSAGDVNGDGFSDIIVGAPYLDNTQLDEGMAFVWLGSSGGLGDNVTYPILQADWYAESNWAVSYLGASVASAGDVNGDGYSDIVIGAPYCNRYGLDEAGHVLVWYGSASGLGVNGTLDNSDWRVIGNYPNGHLGTSVASAGDVNADGYSDVLAGGVEHVKAWYGSQQGLHQVDLDWIVWGGTNNLGHSVSTAGDINGDGYSDVVIGAPNESSVVTYNEGAVYAYCGSPSGLPGYGSTAPAYACWYDYGNRQDAHLGYSVSTAGDVNGDGYADIIAGAPDWANPTANEGQARVYYGGSVGPILNSHGDWKVEGDTTAKLGISVASAGDVNGDTFADVLIGGSSFDYNGGKADLYFGNGAPGKSIVLRQTQYDSTNLHNLGGVRADSHFFMKLTTYNPGGKSWVKAQNEIKQLGTNFNGIGVSEYGGGMSGTDISLISSALQTGKSYHWRLRLLFSPVTNPFDPPHGRWLHIPWSGWNETDLRRPVYSLYLPLVIR
jgi:hypothetical protein